MHLIFEEKHFLYFSKRINVFVSSLHNLLNSNVTFSSIAEDGDEVTLMYAKHEVSNIFSFCMFYFLQVLV